MAPSRALFFKFLQLSHFGRLEGRVGLFMFQRTLGTLPTESAFMQKTAQVVRADADSVLLSQPLHQLRCGPGSRRLIDHALHSIEMFRFDYGRSSWTWSVWKLAEAAYQECFDILAHCLFMASQMPCNMGNAPASIRESDHLKSIPTLRGNPLLTGACFQFLTLGRIQSNDNHGRFTPTINYTIHLHHCA